MVMLETSVYGNLVTTSPSSRWEGLMNFSIADDGDHLLPPIRTLHQHTQSVGATGGVYKGQGRNQRRLVRETGWRVCEPLHHLRGQLLCLLPWALSTEHCASSQGPSLDGGRLYLKHCRSDAHPHLVCELHP
jgi:hypothetical protein